METHTQSSTVPILIEELVLEILLWLPVKSLLRSRCVCKHWNSLISHPNFVKLHLKRSARNPMLLFLRKTVLDYDYYHSIVPCYVHSLLENPSSTTTTIDDDDCYRFGDSSMYLDIIGSCNGLICLDDTTSYQNIHFVCLWNPATKLTSIMKCLHSAHSSFRFAFGYDNLSGSYKIVEYSLVSAVGESQKSPVRIFSWSDNCWRTIHSFPVVPFISRLGPGHNNGVYFNGTLNWLALCNINSNDYEWDDTIAIAQLVIVSLDMGIETFTQLLLPRCCLDEAPHAEPTIGVLVDYLCFTRDYRGTHLVVWQMKEFGVEKSWSQFIKVSYQDLQLDCLGLTFTVLPLCVSQNGDVLIIATVSEEQAILYHRSDNRVQRIELPGSICWNSTKDYIESLVSPCWN